MIPNHFESTRQLATRGFPEPPKGRKTVYPDSHYRDVADAYVRMYEEDGSQPIRKPLAERHDVTVSTIDSWLDKATKLGFLAAGTRGKPSDRRGPNFEKFS